MRYYNDLHTKCFLLVSMQIQHFEVLKVVADEVWHRFSQPQVHELSGVHRRPNVELSETFCVSLAYFTYSRTTWSSAHTTPLSGTEQFGSSGQFKNDGKKFVFSNLKPSLSKTSTKERKKDDIENNCYNAQKRKKPAGVKETATATKDTKTQIITRVELVLYSFEIENVRFIIVIYLAK